MIQRASEAVLVKVGAVASGRRAGSFERRGVSFFKLLNFSSEIPLRCWGRVPGPTLCLRGWQRRVPVLRKTQGQQAAELLAPYSGKLNTNQVLQPRLQLEFRRIPPTTHFVFAKTMKRQAK